MPLLLLGAFFFAVDVGGIDKRKTTEDKIEDDKAMVYGVLGDYVVDETPSYGLFIQLCGRAVFVDIKQDQLLDLRKAHAEFLHQHSSELGDRLRQFVEINPRFATRSIQYIGLHSANVDQGEVFWSPDGYTLLQDLKFVD